MANIINLNGTSWSIPAGWTTLNGYGSYEFSGQFQMAENPPALDFSGLYMGYEYDSGLVADIDRIAIYVVDSHVYEPEYNNLTPSDAFSILNISGATAEESASFYDWLIANNATLTAGEPVVPKTPTLTYDLTKLNLAAGTYNISVVAKADGYKNSVASEVVEYIVAEAQDELQGTWVLNTTLTSFGSSSSIKINASAYYMNYDNTVLFEETIDQLNLYFTGSVNPVLSYYPLGDAQNAFYASNGNIYGYTIHDTSYSVEPNSVDGQLLRTLIINSKLAEVENGDTLLTWLKANATKQEAEEPSLPVWNGTDLTGTTWNVPSGWTATAGYGAFDDLSFNLKINDEDCGSFGFLRIGYYGNEVDWYSRENSIAYSLPSEITNDNSFTLTIDKGTDATNTSLISWLRANGELTSHQMPTPTIGTFKKQYYDDTNFTTYEFEVGMTWQEWLDKYKESGWLVINGYVYTIAGAMNSAIFYNSDKVLPTDLIVNGATYMAVYTSSSGGSN